MAAQNRVAIRFYNGTHNQAYAAVLSLEEGRLKVDCNGRSEWFRVEDAEYLAAVGNVPPALELPNDARIEFHQGIVPDWLPLKHKTMLRRVGRLENSWKWAAAALVMMVLAVGALFRWGIPLAADYVAHALPETTLQTVGNQAEEAIVEITKTSGLSPSRQAEIRQRYVQVLQPERPAKLLFRKGEMLGANAFAIPNHTIVLTDELVALAANDEEILAGLAHEQGHLVHRHSLQQVLRGIGVGVFLAAVTGDAGDLLSNLPVMLVSANYSQAFEFEADHYALGALKQAGIAPKHLGDLLAKLEAKHGNGEAGAWQVLSSHPQTEERLRRIRAYR